MPYSLSPDARIVHCLFSLGCGGAERNLVTTVRELTAAGYHDQHIVLSDFSTPANLYYEEALLPLATLHRAGDKTGKLQGTLPFPLALLPQRLKGNIIKIQNCLRRIRPQVAHIWSDNPYAAVAASLLSVPRILIAWQSMPPVFFHSVGEYTWRDRPKTWLDGRLSRLALQNPAVRLSCVTRRGGEGYARWLGISPERVRALYHGMDVSKWRRPSDESILAEKARLGIPAHASVIVGLMRFDPVKRPSLWLEAAERVRREYGDSVYFLCYGDGPLRNGLLERARKAGVLLPGVTRDVPLALALADLFLHTARVEGLPTVHVESQLMGVPIITTDAGGTRETLLDGVTARIVPEQPDMAAAVAREVISALRDADFRGRARQEGPRFVKETFSTEKMLQTTLDLYS